MAPDQIHISATSRGIFDHFFCFICDEYVWDCEHLIADRLIAPNVPAIPGNQFQRFRYDGRTRTLEIDFRVTAPHAYDEIPLPPPARVIQYRNAPRYVFRRLIAGKSARAQERYWEDHIQRQFDHQTVRTVCRLPRIYRITEARNIKRFTFDEYAGTSPRDEQTIVRLTIMAMKILLLRTLAPRRVTGLGGLVQCQSCGAVEANIKSLRHRNCLWAALVRNADRPI